MAIARSPAVTFAIDEQPDEALVTRVLRGDSASFELLMRRHNQRIYRAVRSIVQNEHETEHVMQQAYTNAFVLLDQFSAPATFSTWLTRIAVREAIARARHRGQYHLFDEERSNVKPFVARSASPNLEQRPFAGDELRGLLEWAIDTLPNGMREVFVLREVEGLSTVEAAYCLDASEDVVKTRLSRARDTLTQLLLERAGAIAPDAFRFFRPRCDRIVARVLARIANQPPPAA